MATHFSIVAWEIPPRSLVGYNPWGRKESDMTEHKITLYVHLEYCIHPICDLIVNGLPT